MPVHSLVFNFISITFPPRLLCLLHQWSSLLFFYSAEFIPAVSLLPGDSDCRKQCLFLSLLRNGRHASFVHFTSFIFARKIEPSGRTNTIVRAKVYMESICGLCHFSTAVTLYNTSI